MPVNCKPKQPNVTDEERNRIVEDLLDESSIVNGKRKLAHGTAKRASKRSERSGYNIWKRALDNRRATGSYTADSPRQRLYK
eukprot:scaffold16636_cov237-Amphora_coffeaeformis.AAC.6